MEPLMYAGLNPQKRLYLRAIIEHPGFAVVRELLEDACRQATQAVIKLNPEDENYDTLVKARQMTARLTNELAGMLIKSMIMHAETSKMETAAKTEETVEAKPTLVGSKYGSFVINPRKSGDQQDNQSKVG